MDLETAYRGPDITFRVAPAMLEQLVRDYRDCEIAEGKLRVAGDRWTFMTVLGRPDAAAEDADPAPPPTEDARYAAVAD